VIGMNGAGKTTLLGALMGLVRTRKGSVRFEGQEITNLSTSHINSLGIALLLQQDSVFRSLTVRENLELAARRHPNETLGAPEGSVWDIFPALEPLQNRRAGLLSGGESRMLAIAMVLSQRSKLLLLDEPTAGLSRPAASGLLQSLAALNRQHGMTMLLVEPNVRLAVSLAHRVYLLASGRAFEQSRENLASSEQILNVLLRARGENGNPER